MKALSLFSGIGGIDLACDWAGIETVAFCEREPFCQKVLRKHWPTVPIYDDVCTLTKERLEADGIGTIELIHGGYPCQPFSNAGKREGANDDRHLWPEVFRLIQALQPGWFVGENVAGHVSLGLDIVLSDLESVGYSTETFIIPAAAVESPNRRDRVIIVGYSERIRQRWESRWGSEPLFKNRYKRLEEGFMADTKSDIEGRLPIGEGTSNTRPACSCENVAHATSERCGEAREHSERSEEWTTCSSETLADSQCLRQSRQGELIQPSYTETNRERETDRAIDVRLQQEWAAQSRLGGDSNGLSYRLDEHRWPAPYGSDQYEWEPPRVALGIKNRVGRLKSLGNAVNPHQIFPVLAAIKQIEDMLSE